MADILITDAERALADLFEARAAHFTARPLDRSRAEAFERFAAAGLPHRRVEAYKYTDLKAKLRTLPPAAAPMPAEDIAEALANHAPLPGVAGRIVIANGRYVPTMSDAPGVTVADILDPAADLCGVGTLVAGNTDPLTLANASLFEGGVVIAVTGEAPLIEILHVVAEGVLVMGRVAVTLAQGAHARFVERVVGAEAAVVNNLTELTIPDGARGDWIRIAHGEAASSTHLASFHTSLGEKSQLEHLTISTGAGLSRGQIFALVGGDEAAANFRTATISVGQRHADSTLVVRHDALNSTSTEEFRSAVGQGGASIVQGRIIVDPGAQKTDAKMMSRGLYLDDDGEMVNKPELEIFADDVQCGHGATSGDLNEDMVFYLRARGIPETEARRLLVEAFLLEALDRIDDEPLHEALATHLTEALAEAGAS